MKSAELFGLDGRTALATGSPRGLGREIALCLAQNGASLVLADVVYPEETAGQIQSFGSRCLAIQTDISDEAAVKHLVKSLLSEYAQVDIVVNNPGISQLSYTPTENLPVEK